MTINSNQKKELKLLGVWALLLAAGWFFIRSLLGASLWQDVYILMFLAILITRVLYRNLSRLVEHVNEEDQLVIFCYTATGSLLLIVVLTLIVCVLLLLKPNWRWLQEFWWSFVLFPYHIFLYSTVLLWSIRLSWLLAKLIAKLRGNQVASGDET